MSDATNTETTATDPRMAGSDPRGTGSDPRAAMAQAVGGGHGRHRGPVSAQDDEATSRGRHRKPSEQSDAAA
jgi:hypothetical protein